jgi:F-type H+-transporting ATPase subunit b
MAEFVRRRTAAAETKIAQAEAQAAAEVRAAAVDAAVRASEQVLRGELSGPAAETLVTSSLGDVSRKLNG